MNPSKPNQAIIEAKEEYDRIQSSKTPQNASEMMITKDEDIINSIPPDNEISDWDSTLMDGLEDEGFEWVKPTVEGPKINRLSYVKRNG
jgi:hypothetical protein